MLFYVDNLDVPQIPTVFSYHAIGAMVIGAQCEEGEPRALL